MTALRAVVRISGQTSGGKATLITGDATGELRFTPGSFTVDVDTTVIPPRVVVGLPAGVTSLLEDLLDVESENSYVGIKAQLVDDDARLITLETAETVTLVPWAASVTLDWNELATRHVKLTSDSGTVATIQAPVNAIEGLTYTITADNLAGTGQNVAWSSDWDLDSPPWVVIYPGVGGAIPFNGDPEIFTWTFRYVGGKMRLLSANFGSDA